MGHPRYTGDEIETLGKRLYDERIRAHLTPEQFGQFLVINVETGEYEIDADDEVAARRAYERFPDAPLYGMRVGHPAWGRIGAPGAVPAP